QRRDLEPSGDEERARIDASAVRRIEHDRAAPFGRLENLKGRLELVFHFGHGKGQLSLDRARTSTPRFWHHYGRKPAIVHGAKPTARSRLALDSPCPAIRGRFNSLFTRHPPLWGGKNKGRRQLTNSEQGGDHGEDHSCRGR